jgi:uncharacterized protein YcfJ
MKSLLVGLFLAIVAYAESYSYYEIVPVYRSEPMYKEVTISIPHRQCWTEEVPVNDSSTAGSLIGGIAGGILGHQVGGGSGKDVATVAGAIIGTIIGSKMGSDGRKYDVVRRCKTVYDHRRELQLVGYKNYFEYNGKTLVKIADRKLHEVRVKVTVSY